MSQGCADVPLMKAWHSLWLGGEMGGGTRGRETFKSNCAPCGAGNLDVLWEARLSQPSVPTETYSCLILFILQLHSRKCDVYPSKSELWYDHSLLPDGTWTVRRNKDGGVGKSCLSKASAKGYHSLWLWRFNYCISAALRQRGQKYPHSECN